MTRLLFIDADGCLHPSPPHSGLKRLCWLPDLVDLLDPYEEVGVAFHSGWRLDMPADYIASHMAPLGPRYRGVTLGPKRYPSILRFVGQHGVEDYRIVDDMPQEFPTPAPAELIVCNGRLGLTDPAAREQLDTWLQR